MRTFLFLFFSSALLCAAAVDAQPALRASTLTIAKGGDATKAPLAIEFKKDGVGVTGVSPGGAVILFGMERSIAENMEQSVDLWDERLSDTDGDGKVLYPLPRPSPPLTLMAAVDEEDGRYIIVTPGGFRPKTIDDNGELKNNEKGEIVEFQHAMSTAEVLLVRPGKGAWTVSINDGDSRDGDGKRDSKVTIRFDKMKSSRGKPDQPGPDHLLPHDVLIVMNPLTFELYAVDVKDKQ